MYKFLCSIFLICNTLIVFGQSQKATPIIPKPQQIKFGSGLFSLSKIERVYYPSKNENFKKMALQFQSLVPVKTTLASISGPNFGKEKSIILWQNKQYTNPEQYKLQITSHGILVEAGSDKGIFYALQSLQQIIDFAVQEQDSKEIKFPLMIIEDNPRFAYRGLHLDVSRHFFTVEFIKKYIDMMARYKYNTFHWHLTDDQGWRIEIKQFPLLTEVGAYRKATLIGHHSDIPAKFDSTEYGGFYTQNEIRDVVKYAKEKFVDIIPEIEMPGHSSAALAAYPEFRCDGKELPVATGWGIPDGVFCTKDTSLWFIKQILNEVCDLFPGKYIHIGGDEVDKTNWKSCTACQTIKRRNNLKTEDELQSYFIKEVEKFLRKKGKQIIGWDEILEGGVSPFATIMSWRGTEGGLTAAKAGHDVIMTPGSNCYFDHYQSISSTEPLAIGGYLPLEKVYDYEPIPQGLPKDKEIYIKGAQGNVWTEYIADENKVWYMSYPRALALAEVNWTEPGMKNYSDFLRRMQVHFPWFSNKGIQLSKAFAELKYETYKSDTGVLFKIIRPKTTGKLLIEAAVGNIVQQEYITTDSFVINKTQQFKAWFQLNDKSLGKSLSIDFKNHLAAGKTISLQQTPSPRYFSGDAICLINGIKAPSTKFSGDEWLGMEGKDFDATIDLGKENNVDSIYMEFYHSPGSWIHQPKDISIESSNDGVVFTPLIYKNLKNPEKAFIPVELNLEKKVSLRYLKIHVTNHGVIESGLDGAGHKAWLFVGEIMVE